MSTVDEYDRLAGEARDDTVEVAEVLREAGYIQTRLHRLGDHTRAKQLEAVHARLVERFPSLRGIVRVDDPDVDYVIEEAVQLRGTERAHEHALAREREIGAERDRALEAALWRDRVDAAVEHLDGKPMLGAIRKRRRQESP